MNFKIFFKAKLFIDFIHPFVNFLRFFCIFGGGGVMNYKLYFALSGDLSDWIAGKAQNACI